MRKPTTGEPYAGKPPVRFGGRGGAKAFPTPIPFPRDSPSKRSHHWLRSQLLLRIAASGDEAPGNRRASGGRTVDCFASLAMPAEAAWVLSRLRTLRTGASAAGKGRTSMSRGRRSQERGRAWAASGRAGFLEGRAGPREVAAGSHTNSTVDVYAMNGESVQAKVHFLF